MTYSTLSLDWPSAGVARVRLTRESELNSLRLELLDDLDHAIDAVTAARARVLVITGTGRAFCGGAHLKYFAGPDRIFTDRFDTRDRYFGRIARLFDKIEAMAARNHGGPAALQRKLDDHAVDAKKIRQGDDRFLAGMSHAVFSAGLFPGAQEPQVANALVTLLTSAAARPVYQRKGMEPVG